MMHTIEPRPITLGQIQHLLEIYHGKTSADLSTDVQVDSSRTKGKFRHYMPFFGSSNIVAKIENLVKQISSTGINYHEVIPERFQSRLLELVSAGENERQGSATQLLCKRISAVMHTNMRPELVISKDELIVMSGFGFAVSALRIAMNYYPAATILGSGAVLLVLLQLLYREFNKDARKLPGNNIELYPSHPLVKKGMEYADKLQLPSCPKIYLKENMVNAQALPFSIPGSTAGVIVYGTPLLNMLDTEESNAVLAHEFGHLKDLLPWRRKIARFGSVLGVPIFTSAVSWLISRLSQYIFAENTPVAMSVLNWLLMLYFTIIMVSRAGQAMEIYADNVAKELSGPLAQSSSIRKLHLLSRRNHDHFISAHPELTKILLFLGFDDLFSSHPGAIKRMKI